MYNIKAPSLQSLESDRGSNDSLLAESLQLDIEELDNDEYSLPPIDTLPSLESVLNDLDDEFEDTVRDIVMPTTTNDEILKQTSVLKHLVLQGVSAQICSAAERINAGHPSSITVNQRIAVGTSHGYVLCFDLSQALRWCCQEYTAQGAVSSMSFNEDSTRLLAGFSRGYIIMLDSLKGDVIRVLADVITPNTGVLHLKWAERPAFALCSDSGGSVWCLSFTRRLGIRGYDSKCLFSGARGEVCAVEPLLIGDQVHPLKSYTIVALATLSKFFVVVIKPRLKVIKYQILTGPGECLPLISWQLVLIQAADSSRNIDPVLAVGRGHQLYFHQLSYHQGRMTLLYLRKINLSYNLLALHWMGPKSIVCLDTSEVLHISEVRTNQELGSLDICNAGLIYNSSQFKGLATGGNVSPALALAGGSACYNSIISKEGQLYVLGDKSLHLISARSWTDRIAHLANQNSWYDAFQLAIETYRSVSDRPKRCLTVKSKIIKLFYDYVNTTNRYPDNCLNQIISCLIEFGECDLLWGELWDRLSSKDLFINIVSDHILNNHVNTISPIVSQELVSYWERISTTKLEEIILKLNWQCLDLHQVLKIAKSEKMYQCQMHLNTKALGDYIISLTELIPLVLEEDPILGNSILVYISSCLAGRGYPTGDILPDDILTVKHEVLRCLTVIHTKNALDSESSYPYLRILLKFNIRETLNVLSLAFQEKEFCDDLGRSHRSRIINIILSITISDDSVWSEIGSLLYFIVQQIVSKSLPEESIDSLIQKIIKYISMEHIEGEANREHMERESAWLDLIKTNYMTCIPRNDLLQMAKSAKCYRVVEYLLEQSNVYENIIEECYLNDKTRHVELFAYIQNNIASTNHNIYQQIKNNFLILFGINPIEIVNIITLNYSEKIDSFLKLFQNNSHSIFLFLEQVFINNNNNIKVINLDKYSENYLKLLCQYNKNNVLLFLQNYNSLKLDSAIEIVQAYKLLGPLIYLYEKQGDFRSAFDLSLELLESSHDDLELLEKHAIDVALLCSRASQTLSDNDREELWFKLINYVIVIPNFNNIIKTILHSASHHVNLHKLIQLILNFNKHEGNFGDIKHLIVDMLSNSRYEILLVNTTSKILENDVYNLLSKEKHISNKGLMIKSVKCVVCRLKLHPMYGGSIKSAMIYGTCGHSVHEDCIINKNECPRCGISVKEQIVLAKPSLIIQTSLNNSSKLTLDAPPRLGIVSKIQ